jgi:hypothetical protein
MPADTSLNNGFPYLTNITPTAETRTSFNP